MASSITNPNLVIASDKAIMEAQRGIALATLFTTDFSAEMKGVGSTISVPVFSGDATEYSEDSEAVNDFETVDLASKPVNVALDHIVKATFKVGLADLTEINKAGTFRNAGIAGGRAIGCKLEELIMGVLTYDKRMGKFDSFTVAKLGKAIAAAQKLGLDPTTLVAILTPDSYGDLMDANIANAAIANGVSIAEALGQKYGIKAIVCSSKVPENATSGTDGKVCGVLVADAAIAIGGRAIEQAVEGTYKEYGVAEDEKSGLPVTTFVHGAAGRNSGFLNVACQLGVKLTRDASNKAPGFIQLVAA